MSDQQHSENAPTQRTGTLRFEGKELKRIPDHGEMIVAVTIVSAFDDDDVKVPLSYYVGVMRALSDTSDITFEVRDLIIYDLPFDVNDVSVMLRTFFGKRHLEALHLKRCELSPFMLTSLISSLLNDGVSFVTFVDNRNAIDGDFALQGSFNPFSLLISAPGNALTTLVLNQNHLTPKSLASLFGACCSEHSRLEMLSLGETNFDDSCLESVYEFMTNPNLTVRTLDLWENPLSTHHTAAPGATSGTDKLRAALAHSDCKITTCYSTLMDPNEVIVRRGDGHRVLAAVQANPDVPSDIFRVVKSLLMLNLKDPDPLNPAGKDFQPAALVMGLEEEEEEEEEA